jgi:hypothetical protein
MGNNATYIKWFKERLLSRIPQVKSVYLGESFDFLGRPATDFPLIEMQFIGLPSTEFIAQRQRTRNVIIALQAYIKRDPRPYSDQDMYDIVDLQEEIDKVIFGIYDAVIAGDTTLPPKFIKLHAMYDSFAVHEIEPDVSSCLFEFSAEFTV